MRVGAAARDVWEGWRGHPGRLVPVAAALMGGMLALMLLWAALSALRAEAERLEAGLGADGLLVEATGDGAGWSEEQVEAIRRAMEGAAVVCGLGDARQTAEGRSVVETGTELVAVRGAWRWQGRAPDALDRRGGGAANGCWLEVEAARRERVGIGDVVVVDGAGMAVAGIYDTGGAWIPGVPADAVLVMPGRAGSAGEGSRPIARRLLVRAAAGRSVGETEARLREALRSPLLAAKGTGPAGEGAMVWMTAESLLREVRGWQRTVRWVGGLAAALGLGLAAVTLACIQLLDVRERRTEIGLRRALGATRGQVAGLFLAEATGLAAVAAAVAGGGVWALAPWLATWAPIPLRFTAGTWAGPMAVALGLVAVCSVLPARAAAGVEPAIGVRE